MGEFLTINGQIDNYIIRLEISNDCQAAYIIMDCADMEEESELKRERVLEFLQSNKVCYGIDIEEVDRIVQNNILNSRVKVANGKPKMDGENAHVKLHFEINKDIKPKIDEKGRMDFKELNKINSVEKGTLLAEKTLPTQGIDGVDVYGRTVKASPGKNVEFKCGKNVSLSEDGLRLISEAEGIVEFSDGRISVNHAINIEGDIDTSTGNVRFNGDVIIKGDVKTGFLVQAEGNVHVYGVIEGAIVNANGSIVVEGGIQGNDRANIFAKKGITCKYIENAKKITSESDIVTDFIIHSNVYCFGSLFLMGRKSMIVGGNIFVKKEIDTGFLGSAMGTRTNVDIGVDDNMRIKLQAYCDEKEFVLKNLKNLNESIETFKKAMKSGAIPDEKKKLVQKSVDMYNGLVEKLKIIDLEIKKLEIQISSLNEGAVTVRKAAYPGVKITIGNSTKYIRNETEASRFIIEDGQIVSRAI